jgi:hypothetical protein
MAKPFDSAASAAAAAAPNQVAYERLRAVACVASSQATS